MSWVKVLKVMSCGMKIWLSCGGISKNIDKILPLIKISLYLRILSLVPLATQRVPWQHLQQLRNQQRVQMLVASKHFSKSCQLAKRLPTFFWVLTAQGTSQAVCHHYEGEIKISCRGGLGKRKGNSNKYQKHTKRKVEEMTLSLV